MGKLIFHRKNHQGVTIVTPAGPIRLWVAKDHGRVKMTFEAPAEIRIIRDDAVRQEPREPGDPQPAATDAPSRSTRRRKRRKAKAA